MTHIFIINPYSGQSSLADGLRDKLGTMSGLNYYVFNTRYPGYEKILVGKIRHFFEGEKLRFYCCGGEGTMRNMLCGFDDLSEAEVAFFPCGMTNDFLKVFRPEEAAYFRDIEELIYGDVINVDYIHTNYGAALNTISFGLDTQMCLLMDDYRALKIFGDTLPYSAAIVHSILLTQQQSYDLEIDGEKLSGVSAETIFGSGNYLGGNLYFSDSNNVFDGKGGFISAPKLNSIKEIQIMIAMMKHDMNHIHKVCSHGEFERFSIRRTDGSPFSLNFDGELQSGITQLDAHIVRKGLKFVVPKGLKGGGGNE